MKVIEQLVRSRFGDPAEGEDVVLVTDDYVAVIDGATSRAPDDAPNTRGRVAAEIVADAVTHLPAGVDAFQAFDMVTGRLRERLSAPQLDDPALRPCAAAIILSAARREIWRVADCSYVLDGQAFTTGTEVDRFAAGCRAAFLEASIAAGTAIDELRQHDTGADLIRPLVRAAAHLRNRVSPTAWAYGALDGTPIPRGYIEVQALGPNERDVVLASDGYPTPKNNLDASEVELRETLAKDPLMFRTHRGTRGQMAGMESFDDRAFVRVLLSA